MQFTLERELEEDGRWLAEVSDLPGALAYGSTAAEAAAKAQALASGCWPSGSNTARLVLLTSPSLCLLAYEPVALDESEGCPIGLGRLSPGYGP
jgi:hypothetical protein